MDNCCLMSKKQNRMADKLKAWLLCVAVVGLVGLFVSCKAEEDEINSMNSPMTDGLVETDAYVGNWSIDGTVVDTTTVRLYRGASVLDVEFWHMPCKELLTRAGIAAEAVEKLETAGFIATFRLMGNSTSRLYYSFVPRTYAFDAWYGGAKYQVKLQLSVESNAVWELPGSASAQGGRLSVVLLSRWLEIDEETVRQYAPELKLTLNTTKKLE